MNTRYDWAIDKLKHFGDKEKKKGDSSRIQKMGKAINDKCGAIEVFFFKKKELNNYFFCMRCVLKLFETEQFFFLWLCDIGLEKKG